MAVTKPLEENLCCGKEMVKVGEAVTIIIPVAQP
jgi:hypothetical protein